jgi:hypothetical protein
MSLLTNHNQGDQNGRIIVHWAIVYFDQFWQIHMYLIGRAAFWGDFFHKLIWSPVSGTTEYCFCPNASEPLNEVDTLFVPW